MRKGTAVIGSTFEKYFEACLTVKKWNVVRIPDGCRQVTPFKIVRVKSPFDFLASKKGKVFFCDAKTCEGKTFVYSKINQLQLKELLALEESGFHAGYVINFRETNTYSFVSAGTLSLVAPGESIKAPECNDLGREIDIDQIFLSEKSLS